MKIKIEGKKYMKKIFKTKVLYFILGALIFGTIGVSAATYFESNAVTYDNKESGLNSTNVQGAIDELYNACKTPATGGNGILEKVDIVTSGDGLYEDEYEEGRFIFKGGNPNNYITFNNERAGWRIISVEPDKTIKIVKTANINTSRNLAWDTSESNNWARPATLNTYLNGTYYNGLNNTARSQIVASNFSIGAITYDNNNMSTQVSNENVIKWYGNVALPTASEYIRTNSNKSSCGTLSLINSNSSSCVNTGWMDTTSENWWWTLSPVSAFSVYLNHVFYVASHGVIYYSGLASKTNYAVRPALYLSSKVQITGGNGSQNNPYTIK